MKFLGGAIANYKTALETRRENLTVFISELKQRTENVESWYRWMRQNQWTKFFQRMCLDLYVNPHTGLTGAIQ
jgi:hypothetical protein